MEDYKKKYEQALDNFKKIKAANKDNKELVDFIEYEYPELKDKDERIRKCIVAVVCAAIWNSEFSTSKDECLAWLEKQGEQKSVWSEEDEDMIDLLVNILENNHP